jgi:hypothetical protein
MNTKLLKIAAFAAVSFSTMAFLACGDDSSNNVTPYAPAVSSGMIINESSSSAVTTSSAELNGLWYYFIDAGNENAEVKWGPNPDQAAIVDEYTPGDGKPVDQQVLVRCNGGVCGKVYLTATDGSWNALLLQYFLGPDSLEGYNFSSVPGVCVRYKAVYSGSSVDYLNALQSMQVRLEVADNYVSSRNYNAKFGYEVVENLITGNKGELRVLNLAWTDFTTNEYYANEAYTIADAVAHLHSIQVVLTQNSDYDVAIRFDVEKIGVYGTCAN